MEYFPGYTAHAVWHSAGRECDGIDEILCQRVELLQVWSRQCQGQVANMTKKNRTSNELSASLWLGDGFMILNILPLRTDDA